MANHQETPIKAEVVALSSNVGVGRYSEKELQEKSNDELLVINENLGDPELSAFAVATLSKENLTPDMARLISDARQNLISSILLWQDSPPAENDATRSAKENTKAVAPNGSFIPEQKWLPIAPMPTDLCRVSPFFPMSTKEKKNRQYINNMVITKSSWGEIVYSGPKLSVEEEDLLMASIAALDQIKNRVETSYREEGDQKGKITYTYKGPASTILKNMGKKDGGSQYKQLIEGYQLMMGGVVRLQINKRSGKGKSRIDVTDLTNLISHVKFKQGEKYLEFTINPYFYESYIGGRVTLIDVIERSKLRSPIAKALNRFIVSHRDPLWIGHFLTLAKSLNLDLEQEDKQLRRQITNAIKALQDSNILTSKSGFNYSGTKDVVTLERVSKKGIERKKLNQKNNRFSAYQSPLPIKQT